MLRSFVCFLHRIFILGLTKEHSGNLTVSARGASNVTKHEENGLTVPHFAGKKQNIQNLKYIVGHFLIYKMSQKCSCITKGTFLNYSYFHKTKMNIHTLREGGASILKRNHIGDVFR